MAEAPTISFADESTMFATWRSIAMPVFGFRPPSEESVRMLGRLLEGHGRTVGKGKLVEVTWLDTNATMPSAEVRAALEGMVPRVTPYYGSVAAVYEGDGFKSAMIRGLLTSFQMMSRSKYPQKTFSRIEECSPWTYQNAIGLGMRAAASSEVDEAIRAVVTEGIRRGVLSPRG